MTIKFSRADDGEVNVATEFGETIRVEEMFSHIRSASAGMTETALRIGTSRGLTQDEVMEVLFPDDDDTNGDDAP